MAMSGLRIAIVGGGLGGTTAAILLQQSGYDVQVYEQAPEINRIGAGIHLHANVMRIMKAIGVDKTMLGIGLCPQTWLNRTWDTGDVLFAPPVQEWERQYGAPHLIMHRGDMQSVLTAALKPDSMKFAHRLVDLDERRDDLVLRFEDGTTAEADVVIGADGVNSKIREILLGPEAPIYTGFIAYRAIYPAHLLGDFRVSADTTKWWSDDRHWAQEDRHFITYYLTRTRDEIYFVTGSPDPNWQGGVSPMPAEIDEIVACYEGFHSEVMNVIKACPRASKWPLLEREPLPLWSRNRIVLLGDACHPMKPHMGQGAGMAIEDAAVLVRCIRMMGDNYDLAFRLYKANRIVRTSRVQHESHANTWMNYPIDPSWVFAYDALTVPLQPVRADVDALPTSHQEASTGAA
jgi:6-hydroxynicotinate 3-monooxygenase